MIAPTPVDLQIALRNAFVFEAAFFQHPARGCVFRQAGGLDPAKVKMREGVMRQRLNRLAHEALTGKGRADPIAKGARLCRPAPDIVQRDRTRGSQRGQALDGIDIGAQRRACGRG